MTRWRFCDDRGQAFPLYAVFIVMLLFVALAFFTIGKAGVVRSDAQGAADAAALGAAREARDNLTPGIDLAALSPQAWEDFLRGNMLGSGGCDAAGAFAAMNGATATCSQSGLRFTAAVVTNGTVGDSVVPGVSGQHGNAEATAEIIPRCLLKQQESSDPGPSAEPKAPGRIEFECDKGASVTFDPAQPRPWSALGRALFDIRLID
ncbi:pilus assembly protein TadG-related protein [Streptomyces sp. NPDC051577]|uniref:pilus assembly protein TadG-related protein n=1 Tax=Streptomyces sp. NPDC051577 TaxID=3155166 RepID=UPI0034440F56